MLRRVHAPALALAVGLVAAATPASAAHPVSLGCTGERTRVAYVADPEGDLSYGLRLEAVDTRCTVLLRVAAADGTPALHPDGRRVAIDLREASGTRALHLLDDERHLDQRLTDPPTVDGIRAADVRPAWSPDGSTLLFTRRIGDASALFTVPASGGTPQQVPGSEGALSGSWAPDGLRIVYAVGVEGGFDPERGTLVVSGLDGAGRTEITRDGTDPAWSPDGEAIAFSQITDPGRPPFVPTSRRLALVAPTGGAVTPLPASVDARAIRARHPAWLPDGQSLLYSRLRSGTDGNPEPGGLWTVDRSGLRSGPWEDGPGDEARPSVSGPRPGAVVDGAPSTFTPVTPRRVLDTRVTRTPVGPLGSIDVQFASAGIPADATAVALTVTVVAPTSSTDVLARPAGGTSPAASNVNAAAGQTVANAVVVAVGEAGAVTLRNSAGTTHLLVDVAGYYRAGAGGAGFEATAPRRILDTRSSGNVGAAARRLGAAETLDLQVTGELRDADGGTVTVPADATAVVLNLTATGATSNTDLRAYPRPADGAVPEVSNLNLRGGQTAASLATVAVGERGQVRLRNAAGSVDLVADLAGWYSPSAPGRFVPAAPARLLDTRRGLGAAPLPLVAGALLDVAAVGVRGIPPQATAAVLNLTGTGVSTSTDVRAYPAGGDAVPTVSNLNLVRGATRANLAVVKVGADGRVRLRSGAGTISLVADLAGWFVPAT